MFKMLQTLQKLIEFTPSTSDPHAITKLLDYAEGRLALKGMVVERIEHNGIPSLYAHTLGQKHAKVMLQAHVDVVPGGNKFGIHGDKIHGRGCYDMLFAVASFLHIIDNLGALDDYDLSILLTGDEEIGGANGTQAILDTTYYSCDVCVLPDAGEGLGTLSVAAKGLYNIKIRVNGVSHHGSRPWEGDGAASKLVAFLSELSGVFDTTSQDHSTFVVSQLQAGSTALNQGPAEAYAGIDIRYKDSADFELIQQTLNRLTKKYSVDILYESVGRNFELNTEAPLVKDFIKLYESHMGVPIELVKAHGSSDARYFDDKGMPVIMLRPAGGNAHGDDEWLSYESWKKFHTILEHYVLQTSRV